ncbi:wall-associated receptor kinase 1-like [Castanea sativa]|uniref:wall-associated receptor kinase 1-like n=1 Tax=Castanea sativa TaxID=21020 RepID=UPI003F65171C
MGFQFHKMLLQVTWVAVLLSLTTSASAVLYPSALPNCQNSCGGVEIPYPFGMNEGCYLDESFSITCDNSTSQPTYGDVIVKNISIEDHNIEILAYTARDCYNNTGALVNNSNHPTLWSLYFTISDTQNMFMAVGCDTYAYLDGFKNNESFSLGCTSVCVDASNVVNGSCSGIGCCQTEIPKGMKNITLEAHSFNSHLKVWNFNPCSYSFIVQKDKFDFSTDSLQTLPEKMPMVLDWAVGNETWAVGNETCDVNTKNYSCGGNSTCTGSENGGYFCLCLDGYRGNPYLKDGCQDIDECKEGNNNCTSKNTNCVNDPGSYYCVCSVGYHFDDGGACVHPSSNLAIKLAIGIGICIIAMLVCSSSLYLIVNQRKLMKLKQSFFQQNGGLILQQQLSRQDNSTNVVKIFTTEELEKATNNYDENLIIGRGGFGTVYKGFLPDDRIVAVKKSKIVDQSQIEQFINELIVLSQINHTNVVKLLGCCLETQVPLLVYEFVPNGTLFEYIHHESKVSIVPWETRLRIATESAEALSYLHSAASPPIIHRDVKSSNILLDGKHIAKVSDFGASRLVPLDQTQAIATMVQGTFGYLDPEYLHTSQLTEKSDVYSFGVVLVELLTSKKAISFDRPEEERSLALYFLSSLKENRLFEVLEKNIANEENAEQLKEVSNLATRCLRLKGEDRPNMKEVAMKLQGLRKMEKHSWVNVGSNLEETEYLLGGPSDSREYDVNNKITTGYDSVKHHIMLAFDDGR